MKKNSYISVTSLLIAFFVFNHFLFSQNTSEGTLTFEMMNIAGEHFRKGDEFFKQRKFDKAGDEYALSFETLKTNKDAAYNAASAYSLAKNTPKAIEYLTKAVKTGRYDFENDPDFSNIKGTKEYQELLVLAADLKLKMQNQSIEPLIILPKNFDKTKTYPLLVAFHGFNSNPQEFVSVYENIATKHSMILMLCRGSKIIAFNSFTWSFEQEEYERILEEIELVQLKYNINPAKIILTGYSQGANIAYSLGMVFSQLFCGIIPVAGTLPKNVSITRMKNKNIKLYSIVGLRDNPNILEQNREAEKSFTQNNIAFKLKEFDIGHAYPPNKEEVFSEAIQWMLAK
ncbi:MAG: dienelactone hydrolase family protein [Flavobacteriales bacterium]|nr:dienelactone hydrolase family protein [Flavobacteriales bacterium]